MAKCTIDKCNLDGSYNGKCSLHCDKKGYQDDRLSGVLADFFEDLVLYIQKDLKDSLQIKTTDIIGAVSVNQGAQFQGFTDLIAGEKNINEILAKEVVFFCAIKFPDRNSIDTCDFFKLFKLFKGVEFDRSSISFSSINLPNIQVFFQNCTFLNDWSINSFSVLEDVDSQSVFEDCIFIRSVTSPVMKNARDLLKVECNLFKDCQFNKQVAFYRGTYTKSIFNNTEGYNQKLSNLHIENCEFKARFELNDSDIGLLKIKNMEFEGKFELKNNNIEEVIISNVNFIKLFDAYETKFNKLKFSRSIFEDFAGFEKCEFGIEGDENVKVTEFKYITFLNFANFREAKFYNGLDFEHTNLKEPLNFLNAEISYENTNMETYRIIKHSFDNVGNKTEANKYFSLEMKKYRDYFQNIKDEISEHERYLFNKEYRTPLNELVIYKINNFISDNGINYIRPLILMVLSAILYVLACIPLNALIDKNPHSIIIFFNDLASAVPIYGRFLKEGVEFTNLIFHIIFILFTWHFVIAVKRRSSR